MRQMINAELGLKAILCLAILRHHDTGIIDQHIDLIRDQSRSDVRGGLPHRRQGV
jgi:hypothetical protein